MEVRDPVGKSPFRWFRTSLTNRTVIQILLLALLPVILISLATTLRLKSQLQEQLASRLINVSTTIGSQLQDLADDRRDSLVHLKEDSAFIEGMNVLLSVNSSDTEKSNAIEDINGVLDQYFMFGGSEPIFENIAIYDINGNLIHSYKTNWLGTTSILPQDIQQLLATNESALTYDLPPYFPRQMVLLTASLYSNPDLSKIATVIGFSETNLPQNLISNAQLYFTGSNAYFLSKEKFLAGLGLSNQMVAPENLDQEQLGVIRTIVDHSASKGVVPVSWLDNRIVYGFAKPISSLKTTLIVVVPQIYVSSQLKGINDTNILLFGVASIIISILLYWGTRRIIRPIVDLASVTRHFSEGDWSQRARVDRQDEIGQLASAFNQMVDQLSTLYRSMETKVEERKEQLRVASDIALSASQFTDTIKMSENAVELLAKRFTYPFAAIYLTDETGNYLTIEAVSSTFPGGNALKGRRIALNSPALVGWVAAHQQSQVALDISPVETMEQGNLVLYETRSEVAVPISIGNQLIGVLDIQHSIPNAFDPDTVSTLQFLANQLATGLRNILLLMSAQINYEETALLYRASRQISTASTESQVLEIICGALAQTNHVSIILSMGDHYFSIDNIYDPHQDSMDETLIGKKLPIHRDLGDLDALTTTLIDDMNSPSLFESVLALLNQIKCKHAAMIPILENGTPTRIIVLGTRDASPYNQGIIQPFTSIAEIIGSTLDRIHILAHLQDHVTELEILTSLSKAISSETDIQQLLDQLHNQVQAVMGSGLGFFVALYNPNDNLVEFPYLYEDGQVVSMDPIPLGEGLTSYVILNQKPLMIVNDMERAALQLGGKVYGKSAQSWLGVPLIVGGDTIGALVIQDSEHENRFSEADLKLLNILAPQISIAVRNAQLLSEMAQTLRSLHQESQMLNTLLEHLPQQVYFKDREGLLIRVSDSYSKVLGHPQSDIIGKCEVDINGDEFSDSMNDDLSVMEQNQSILNVQKETQLPDGHLSWTVESRIPLHDPEGAAQGVLGIIQDVTDFKKAEHQAIHHTEQIRTVSEIARDATQTLNLDELLTKVVNLVLDRFGYYHASVFLLDSAGEYAVLKQSTGEAGAQMLEIGHRLLVGSLSIVGQAVGNGEPVVSNDVVNDPSYYPNPLLPETRSELAVPLHSGKIILGAIDVQASTKDAFSTEDINILQILADQLAGAIVNSTLYGKSQDSLLKHRLLHQLTGTATAAQSMDEAIAAVVTGLRTSLFGDRVSVYIKSGNNLVLRATAGYETTTPQDESVTMGEGWFGKVTLDRISVLETVDYESLKYSDENPIRSRIAIPIQYTGQLFGVLCLESRYSSAYDENDLELMTTLGNNLGVVIENLQLVNQIRLQMERQQRLFKITDRIRQSTDMETILKTSVSEVGKIMNATHAKIRIAPLTHQPNSGGNSPDPSERENGKEVEE